MGTPARLQHQRDALAPPFSPLHDRPGALEKFPTSLGQECPSYRRMGTPARLQHQYRRAGTAILTDR